MRSTYLIAPALSLLGSAVVCAGGGPNTLNFSDVSAGQVNQTVNEITSNEKQIEVGDFDNDGDPDVVIAVALSDFGQRRNKLYRNDGGVFNEISGAPAIPGFSQTDTSRSAFFRDFDNDGFLDIWIINDSNSGPGPGNDKLYMGQHAGGNFTSYADQTNARLPNNNVSGCNGPGCTGAACSGAAADFDRDGDIDVYCGNYPNSSQDRMYLNDGSANFTEVTNQQVPNDSDYTVDVHAADMNGDGKLDLLISNDFDPNYIYYNDANAESSGEGDFRYLGSEQDLGVAGLGENSMVAGDFDDDGDEDIYWTNRVSQVDVILRNSGNDGNNHAIFGQMPNDTLPKSVTDRVSRKATVGDLNDDGRLDIFVGKEGGGRPTILRNTTINGQISFVDWTPASAFPNGNSLEGWQGNFIDADGDGDKDIFFGAYNDDYLFENVPPLTFDEDDLADIGLPLDTYNGEVIAVTGRGEVGESDNYILDLDNAAATGMVAVIVTGTGDYMIEILKQGSSVVSTTDRGGLGEEEAVQYDSLNPASGFYSVRVTVLASADGGDDPADINGDGTVDAADLAGVLDAWGPNPGHPGDINGDGTVDAADLAGVLDAWGPVVGGGESEYTMELVARDP